MRIVLYENVYNDESNGVCILRCVIRRSARSRHHVVLHDGHVRRRRLRHRRRERADHLCVGRAEAAWASMRGVCGVFDASEPITSPPGLNLLSCIDPRIT